MALPSADLLSKVSTGGDTNVTNWMRASLEFGHRIEIYVTDETVTLYFGLTDAN